MTEDFFISRLMLGFMLVTAFISMWITNTATTAMMTPIMEAVLKQLDKEYTGQEEEDNQEESKDVDQSVSNDKAESEEIRSSEGDISNSVEAEGKEMVELAAPIHPRNISKRGLVAPERYKCLPYTLF